MLNLTDLCVDYGATRVVDGLSLSLEETEILMLVGPTGCGKTTILQAVAGLVPIAGGTVSLGNWQASPQHTVPPEKRNVGMVFQDFALFPHLTVWENVSFRLTDNSPADRWLSLLGLDDLREAVPGRLSGGQKQRVALARALAHEPALILLDEPLSNLDAALKETLRWDIRNALKDAGVPAIWVTHDQGEALSVGDRLGVLKEGKLAQLDTPERCFSAPADRFVARFLGEASFVPASVEGDRVITAYGSALRGDVAVSNPRVDVLVRPDDCTVTAAADAGNGCICAASYEGSTWLYTVEVDDGCRVFVRTSHEQRFVVGERVSLALSSNEPLTVFPVEG